MADQSEQQHPQSQLTIEVAERDAMVAHVLRAYPEEGCGLIIGEFNTGKVTRLWPTENVEASSKLYSIDSREVLRADRAAQETGHEIIGVFHSHTHTDPYPSPTDVRQAMDPTWHYVLVSLRFETPSIRSYRIVDDVIAEEPIFPAI